MKYTAKKVSAALASVTKSSWGSCYSSTEDSKYVVFVSGSTVTSLYSQVGYAGTTYYYKKFEPSQGDIINIDDDSYYVQKTTVTTTSYTKL